MFIITRNTTNEIICTLTEKQTLVDPYFLFVFTHDETKSQTACIAPDSSSYIERYNKFFIEENAAPDNLNAEITLGTPSEYTYCIYEQSSSTNLDPALAENLLETGKARVIADITAPAEFSIPETGTKVFNDNE